MKQKLAAVSIYSACAVSIAALLRHFPGGPVPNQWMTDGERYMQVAAAVSVPVFLFASIRAFFNVRFSYVLGLLAVLLPLPWFLHSELTHFEISNSWITLNLPDWIKGETYRRMAEYKIMAAGVLMIALTYLGLRVLPEHWQLRGSPIQRRLWPVFVLPAALIAFWYIAAVSPYRIPGAVDGIGSDLTILHVVKRGAHFEETVIKIQRDRRFFISRGDRNLLQYHFYGSGRMGVLSSGLFDRVQVLKNDPLLKNLPHLPLKRLQHWNSEGWYITGAADSRLAMTTENGVVPPKEIVDLFNEMISSPSMSSSSSDERDICLGFCYDPPAAMGSLFVNERCRSGPGDTDVCE